MGLFSRLRQRIRLFIKKIIKQDSAELLEAVRKQKELPINNWTVDFLESKRNVQDKEADEVIAKIFDKSNPEAINSFYHYIHRTSETLPDDLPDYIKNYFNNNVALPEWTNPLLLKKAEEFYMDHGGIISLVLCTKSLPECYACAKGAQVLYETGRLSEKNGSLQAFTRRIAETSQFIINVMSPRALNANGLGIRSAQKIRLIHAAIRHYIHKKGWDTEKYGCPINQEDMAGTLMSFSVLVLEGLETLGVKVTETEKEAYFHAWRVIGHYMGLDDDLLPNNVEDGFKLGYMIFDKEKEPSKAGEELTKSLISFMSLNRPSNLLHFVVNDLLRMMMGNETADLLKVPKINQNSSKKVDTIFKKFLGGWENMLTRHQLLQKMRRPLSKVLLNGMLRMMNQGEKIKFFIPPSLQKDWGLNEENKV